MNNQNNKGMGEIRSVRVGNKVITVDGESPLRYVELETNEVFIYPNTKPLKSVKSAPTKKKEISNE